MYNTLCSAEELASHLADPDWIVCDCRHDLGDYEAGRHAYQASHIPGARFLHLDEDLSGPKTGKNGRHPLPHPHTFALRIATLGIDSNKQVVAYDASGGSYAARLWWMLCWIGHARAAVLDGGWDLWTRAGLPTTAEMPLPQPTSYTVRLRADTAVDAEFVAAHLHDGHIAVIDARGPDRFRGENETLDPVAGHIPGALNRFFRNNLDADGRFKSSSRLKQEFENLIGNRPPSQVVQQCGSGVTACHNLLAMERAGLTGSLLFPGSWSEWVSDRARPVER
jgi:thiosulfate/3-mercaptopyruvate sulfurtransferase